MDFSQKDRQTLIRTIWGEARGESLQGKKAVAHVILNRVKKRQWPNSIHEVCVQPWQFSCWNQSDPNRRLIINLNTEASDKVISDCRIAADAILGGEPDFTKGSDHYFATYIATPSWAKGKTPTITIGVHRFFNLHPQPVQPTTPTTMLIPTPPTTAIAGQPIVLSGKTSPQYAGQKVEVKAEHHPLGNPLVNADGSFSLTTVLNQPGNRRISLAIAGQSQLFTLTVYQSEQHQFRLSGSVGVNGTNAVNDVKAVQQRLKDLGYPVGTVDGKVGTNTIAMIRLFQSVIQGRSTVAGDGRVDVNGTTHQWLMAGNAPKWQVMPKSDPKIGYRNRELEETWDNHDYGTSWLADAILAIAADYQKTYRASRPNASEFVINDVSVPHGGNTPDHAGHETGLMCDVFLPRKDGGFGLPTYENTNYDRNACRAMLQSIRRHPLFKLAYFNDPTLINEGLCKRAGGHHHHIHFEIKPPAKK